MPNRCVVWGCDSISNSKEGVFLFSIPFFNDERLEAKRRRRNWVKFVDRKRKKFVLSKGSSICCKHFKPDDFTIRFMLLPGHEKPMIPRLKRDEIGICVCPTLQSGASAEENEPTSDRKRRKRIKTAMEEYRQREATQDETPSTSNEGSMHQSNEETITVENDTEAFESQEESEEAKKDTTADAIPETQPVRKKANKSCTSCSRLRREKKCWRQRWRNQKIQVKEKKDQLHIANQRALQLENEIQALHDEDKQHVYDKIDETLGSGSDDQMELEDMEDDDSPCASDYDDAPYVTETESEEEETLTEDELAGQSETLNMHDKNLRTEPKHIVFLSQLLLLFSFCHSCKADYPLVETRQVGTEVVVSTLCKNPSCQKKEFTWHSQPSMHYTSGQKGPAGNFLLSMAILFAGGSATKVFQIFAHMGLGCISLRSFFKHQTNHLFPIIHLHWKRYQSKLLEKVKALKDGITVAGDGRYDSMGHNAKYGSYTIFCCTQLYLLPQIIHFSLVQRNQAESSNAMELMGFQNCMEFLLEICGLEITTFISDRHISISSHMSKVLTQIKHYYDIWHLKKKIRKVLTKLAKEKHCECLKDWIKPCENHLYWSAMSTYSGDGDLIWAKFKSFLSHVVNVHNNLDDPLYNKCAHREIRNRTWLEKGSTAHDKLVTSLTKTSLMKGIKQASPMEQTSSLEGFHSVVNYFAPKMIAYSYVGMYCRHILAILHFNDNLDRETKKGLDGKEQLRVSYPKFKNGEATIRNICVAQKFDYVEELYGTFLATTKEEVKDAREELKEMAPSPMNSILDKQPVAEAVQKRDERKSMTVHDVPATTPAPAIQAQVDIQRGVPVKAPPKCRQCKQPMKGHNQVKDCPRNKKT